MVNLNSALILAAASILSTAASSSLPRTNQAEKITVSVENAVGANPSVDVGSGTEIIIISANGGGGAPTQHFNEQAMPVKTVHNVTVGGTAGLVYTPNTITAAVGDIVQFWFESKNHTVTQSSFATPCEKMVGGMDSGFMPNPNNMMNPAPMLEFQVTTSAPIWMYCAQQGHCGMGMVFSINPTATMTHAMFQAAAMAQNGTKAATPAAAASAMEMAPSAVASGASMMAGSKAGSSSISVTMGTGTLTSGGTCNCACLCGAGSFPAGVGMGMVGGMGGSMPMASAMAMPSGIAMASSMSMSAKMSTATKMSMATNMPMASTMSMGAKMSMASDTSMTTHMSMVSTMSMGAKMSMASDTSMTTHMSMASNMPASPEISQITAADVTMTSIIAGPTHF